MSLPKPSNEVDLCAMTLSIEALERQTDEIALEAARKIWSMDGINETARVYAMGRVIEKMIQHIGHSLRTKIVADQFIRGAERSGIKVTSMPEGEWLDQQLRDRK